MIAALQVVRLCHCHGSSWSFLHHFTALSVCRHPRMRVPKTGGRSCTLPTCWVPFSLSTSGRVPCRLEARWYVRCAWLPLRFHRNSTMDMILFVLQSLAE